MADTFYVSGAARKQLDDQQKIVERLLNFRRPYDSRRNRLYSQLLGVSPTRMFPDGKTPRSNVFVPYPYANVEQVRSALMQALFFMDPPFETLPRGQKDSDSALAMQRVLEIMLLQRGRLRKTMHEYLGGLATYGFYAMYVGWDWDYDTVPDMEVKPVMNPDGSFVLNPMTGMPQLQAQKIRRKVPRNRPLFQPIDIFDVLIDPDEAHVVRLFDKTLPQMLREQETAEASGHMIYDGEALQKIQTRLAREQDPDQMSIHLAEIWDAVNGTATLIAYPHDSEIVSYKDSRFANRSAERSTWLRNTAPIEPMLVTPTYENPYMHCKVPILYTNYSKLPGEPFGYGVIEPVASLVEHLNNMVRAIEDNWNMGVNQRYYYDIDRIYDLEGLQRANTPGGLVGGQGSMTDALQEIPTHTPSPGDYQILGLYKEMIEAGTSVSDFYSRGVGSSGGNDTATGITSVISQSAKRLVNVAQAIEEDIIEPLLQMTAANIQQFITDEIEVRITDEMPAIPKVNSQFLRIAPADLKGAFDFRLSGSLYMENRAVQQANALRLTEVLAGSPFVKHPEAEWELMRLFRIPYPNRLLKTKEEVMLEQQAMLMEQIALAGMGGGAAAPQPPAGEGQRRYAKPESNPATSASRSEGQLAGANASGLGGMGV